MNIVFFNDLVYILQCCKVVSLCVRFWRPWWRYVSLLWVFPGVHSEFGYPSRIRSHVHSVILLILKINDSQLLLIFGYDFKCAFCWKVCRFVHGTAAVGILSPFFYFCRRWFEPSYHKNDCSIKLMDLFCCDLKF